MTKTQLDGLLRDWGGAVSDNHVRNNLPSSTEIEVSSQPARSLTPKEDQWPSLEVYQLSQIIDKLDKRHINPLIMNLVLGMSYKDVGLKIGLTKDGARSRIEQATIDSSVESLVP